MNEEVFICVSIQKDTVYICNRDWIYTFIIFQQNNSDSQAKYTYSSGKKESISTDSDNYSQNSSLTNSNPSQEINVRYSWISKPSVFGTEQIGY